MCLAKEDVSFALRKFMSLPGRCALCVDMGFKWRFLNKQNETEQVKFEVIVIEFLSFSLDWIARV